ncbi:MAG: sugar phosphate isomerase/epimerase [Oscillospiraceae bacterium]|nr:sugar phosphate isomerase/epimerase [Oscillospiraceae bacterium]
MKFGVCYDLKKVALLEKLGFDYIEGNVTVISRMDDETFEETAKMLDASKVKCEAACCLFPGDIKVTGPDVDMAKVGEYLDKAFARLERLGVKSVVFGSGGARRVPDGFDRASAWHQLVCVGRLLAEKAEEHGLTIAMEPLNKGETNIINSQRDGLALVKDVDRPSFRVLTDFFHVWLENDTREDIAACKGFLQHCHVVNPVGRVGMKLGDGIPYENFFGGLADCEYSGRISYEGAINEEKAEEELANSLAAMKAYAEKFGL